MNERFVGRPAFGPGAGLAEALGDRLAFVRKVYGLFTASLLAATAGAVVALEAGASTSQIAMRLSGGSIVRVPPLVAFFVNHWILALVVLLGATFAASAVRMVPGVNVAALFGFAFVSGVYAGPAIWIAHVMASAGMTISSSPVRDAFALAVVGFAGLSGYALVTRRDFSFLRGFVTIGLFVVIGAGLLNIFLGSAAFSLAVASVAVILFGAYILYDTSRLLRDTDDRDAVGAALGLYLDFFNLFLALLRILGAGRRD